MTRSHGGFVVGLALWALGCACPSTRTTGLTEGGSPRGREGVSQGLGEGGRVAALADALWRAPLRGASESFWKHWGDGKAELSGYRIETMRYGEKRVGHVALIYVTEALDRRTLIKDDADSVPERQRLQVLKLNQVLKFQTGIYPYSVMTSVFAPVASYRSERFAPAKIAFSAQEWCVHVYEQIKPLGGQLFSAMASYFSKQGEAERLKPVPDGALYEDALLIQLRELDGPFHGGKDWQGDLVPALWRARKAHAALEPVRASITRSSAERDGRPVTRFVLEFANVKRIYEVEQASPRRVLRWSESDGERAELLRTARLAYWQLNHLGDERYREELGLDHDGS